MAPVVAQSRREPLHSDHNNRPRSGRGSDLLFRNLVRCRRVHCPKWRLNDYDGVAGLHSVDSFILDASLLEHDIRHIARTDVGIDGKLVPVDGAVPDLVIALAGPVISTVMTLENRLNARRVAGHLRRVR